MPGGSLLCIPPLFRSFSMFSGRPRKEEPIWRGVSVAVLCSIRAGFLRFHVH